MNMDPHMHNPRKTKIRAHNLNVYDQSGRVNFLYSRADLSTLFSLSEPAKELRRVNFGWMCINREGERKKKKRS